MSVQINTKTPSSVEILYARSILYQMLAFFLRYPDAVKEPDAIKNHCFIWRDAVRTLPFKNGLKLEKILEKLCEAFLPATLPDRIRAYENAFGHTVNSATPAYELEYGEEHSHRQPQSLADITAFYNAFGLTVSQASHERSDHVAVECEFMHYLLYKEAFAIEEGTAEQALVTREASQDFLCHHLGYWLPSFARRLGKVSDGLMKEVSDFTFEFVVQDGQFLGIQTGPLDLPIRMIQEKEDSACVSCELNPANRPA